MNRDKSIEEMAKDIYDELPDYEHNYRDCRSTAEEMFKKGYRKASDVAREVIGEVEKIIDKHYNKHIFGAYDLEDEEKEAVMNFSDDVTYEIAELKKKYTEGEKGDG